MISFIEYCHQKDWVIPIHILVESLDFPYTLEDITDQVSQENKNSLMKRGYSNMEFHQCLDEPGHSFFVARKDGAYEIHHQNFQNGVELQDHNVLGKVPSKFVATAFALADAKLKAGKSVRIIARDELIDKYHRLATRISKKRGYTITPYRTDPKTELHSFVLNPPKGPLGFQIKKP